MAEEYWKEYEGGSPKTKIFSDFLIVAISTIHRLNLIVSEDNRTMKAPVSMNAYEKANQRNALKTPKFISIKEIAKL